MYIKEILRQHRRDFTALYKCEFCGAEVESSGYDDRNFHDNVVPKYSCPECEKASGTPFKYRKTKYPEGFQI